MRFLAVLFALFLPTGSVADYTLNQVTVCHQIHQLFLIEHAYKHASHATFTAVRERYHTRLHPSGNPECMSGSYFTVHSATLMFTSQVRYEGKLTIVYWYDVKTITGQVFYAHTFIPVNNNRFRFLSFGTLAPKQE